MRLAAAFLVVSLAAGAALGQQSSNLEASRFYLQEENDTRIISGVSNRDRHYTQGLKLTFLFPENKLPSFADRATQALQERYGRCGSKQTETHCSSGWTLGQNIYTPQDISQRALQPTERPYAAWLYGGALLEMRTPESSQQNPVNRTIEIDVGMIGPAALGRQVQSEWHRIINVARPQGWQNQLRDEPGAVLHYDWRTRRGRAGSASEWSMDFMDRRHVAAGNVFSYAEVDTVVRAGYNMSDDFATAIPQVIALEEDSPANVQAKTEAVPSNVAGSRKSFEAYVFVGATGRFVAVNELLEGNCCAEPPSHGVAHNRAVGEFDLGAAVRFRSMKVTWRQIRRTREFRGQKSADLYGSFTVTYDRNFR